MQEAQVEFLSFYSKLVRLEEPLTDADIRLLLRFYSKLVRLEDIRSSSETSPFEFLFQIGAIRSTTSKPA